MPDEDVKPAKLSDLSRMMGDPHPLRHAVGSLAVHLTGLSKGAKPADLSDIYERLKELETAPKTDAEVVAKG